MDEDAPARNARDEALVDALFVVAAAMSKQPGAVTLEAFKQLPPIQSLRGELPDDLSDAEIEGPRRASPWDADNRRRSRAPGWRPALRRRHDGRGRRPAKKTRAPDV